MQQSIKKVRQIQGAGTYESPHGLLYKFDYTFEDETSISANHKTQQPPFKAGDEVEVVVRGSKDGFSWGQVRKPENTGYNTNSTSQTSGSYQDKQDIILNEWAIGRAMEWEMNQSPPDRVSLRNAIALAKQLKTYAKDLDNAELPNHNNDEQPF
jgi:hypothetical protein